MSPSPEPLWRVFPWDPGAAPGEPFAPGFVPRPSGRGRFDLPPDHSRVLYLAETPEHAVAELLHPWRGRAIGASHLERAGRTLALVSRAPLPEETRVADLCDPEVLNALDLAPDRIASRRREITQPIARAVWDAGWAGLRWWSRFWGDWHTTVLFVERAGAPPKSDTAPVPLDLDHAAVQGAVRALGIEV